MFPLGDEICETTQHRLRRILFDGGTVQLVHIGAVSFEILAVLLEPDT